MPSEAARYTGGRLPLVVVSGFLGAGKSTWLRHQLHERRFGLAHVIVNEAAETPVDDLLLSNAESLTVLAGGCACCHGREALHAALARLCNAMDQADGPAPERVVLETSGLADAGAIAAAIAKHPLLGRRIAIEKTVVVVDAAGGGDQIADEPLARAQVEAADALVVTKANASTKEQRSMLAATLRALAPGATLSWAEFGMPVDVDIDADAKPRALQDETIHMEPILPHRLDLGGASWTAMSAWLSAVLVARGDDIMRVKGVVRTPAGRLLLQSVRKHVQPAAVLPEPGPGRGETSPADDFLVLIGRGIDAARLAASWERFVVAPDVSSQGPGANTSPWLQMRDEHRTAVGRYEAENVTITPRCRK